MHKKRLRMPVKNKAEKSGRLSNLNYNNLIVATKVITVSDLSVFAIAKK